MIKHADGPRDSVAIDYGDAPWWSRSPTAAAEPSPVPQRRMRSGRGLIGLRERVAVYGGELDTGGRPGGGWRVRAGSRWEPASGGRSSECHHERLRGHHSR